MNSEAPTPDNALAHLGWVRALAASLVHDTNVADDIVQEAYLLALERPPRSSNRLGPWLARVTRTLARQEVRSSRSRRTREQLAEQGTPEVQVEEPFEVLERGRRQRVVADAVLNLPQPYAATVLYHYLDGLSTAEVAQRMDCEAATVRKRLERARSLLRERLDEEFGCETRSWALGLALPLAQLRAPTVATGATSAGAKALVWGGLMGTKLIGVAGLLLVCGLFMVGRGYFTSEAPEGAERPGTTHALTLEPQAPSGKALPSKAVLAQLQPSTQAAPMRESTVQAAELNESGTVLLIRALAPDGSVLAEGQVDCFWTHNERVGHLKRKQHISKPIESALTRIRLPVEALSVRVNVSHASFPPGPGVDLMKLRSGPGGETLEGLVEREVDVHMVEAGSAPFVYGDIYVDGRLECPPDLLIFINFAGFAWVNTITSRYRFGPLKPRYEHISVRSDLCVPARFDLEQGVQGEQRIDLELDSGRELLVHAVDALTGENAAGRWVTVFSSVVVERDAFRSISHGNTQSAQADANGTCLFRGMPLEGNATLTQILDDGASRRLLKRVTLKPDMPQVVECEVQLESTATVLTRIFGSLPRSEGARGMRTVELTSWEGGESHAASVDLQGRWSVVVTSHQGWWVRAKLDGKPRSEMILIGLKGEAEYGPVQLGWRGDERLTLRLVDVPRAGDVEVKCTELEGGWHQTFKLAAHGEDLALELQLSGPASVEIRFSPTGSDSELGRKFRVTVDPHFEDEHIVELGASCGRELSISINGEHPPGEGRLILVIPDPQQLEPQTMLVMLSNGRSTNAPVIDAGRCLYVLRHEQYPGLVMGWLDVPEQPAKPLVIHWTGSALPTANLGRGIELQALEGHSLEGLMPSPARFPWKPELLERETLWLPSQISYSLME